MEQRHLLSPGTSGRPDLSDDDIARLLVAGLGRRDRSDMATSRRLSTSDSAHAEDSRSPSPLVPAAVLVPLVRHADGITILLTQRTGHLANHAGQISFPGGRIEDQDADAAAAALRECEEEIGLDRRRVKILGRLDDYVTITGFQVIPLVG
ncbi:MAG TPA: CoA pyrophosphatase, partial [Rhodospirillaceae bacterium]|nr:CoA pyrophosphatase [Rhodospirillaceae bacterium]